MIRLRVITEGQTEQDFVKHVLAPALQPDRIHPTALLLGGIQHYGRVQRDIITELKNDKRSYVTTMLDYYRLPDDFPGMSPSGRTIFEKVTALEDAIAADIAEELGDRFRPDRFIPYLQLHEFEALLFCCPEKLAHECYDDDSAADVQAIRNEFSTPEDINDGDETVPSKRLLKLIPGYQKRTYGVRAARAIGLDAMRRECPHFDEWTKRLQSLGAS
jgi:hypothetical protein